MNGDILTMTQSRWVCCHANNPVDQHHTGLAMVSRLPDAGSTETLGNMTFGLLFGIGPGGWDGWDSWDQKINIQKP